MVRIAIIEDDKRFGALLKKTIELNSEFKVLGIFYNCKVVSEGFDKEKFDIAIVDIQLPDGTGIELLQSLKYKYPSTKYIMCTSYDDDVRIFESLKNGADGYIIKSDMDEKILQAIQDVHDGGSMMSAGIAKKVMQYFVQLQKEEHTMDVLTKQENIILDLLSKGLLYKEVASKTNTQTNTIKKHANNIYKKLQVNNRTEAINIFLKR